jgi:hypothetical protein
MTNRSTLESMRARMPQTPQSTRVTTRSIYFPELERERRLPPSAAAVAGVSHSSAGCASPPDEGA